MLKGYKPIQDRLGEPIYARKIDLSDAFNYHDMTEGRVKDFFFRKEWFYFVYTILLTLTKRWKFLYMAKEEQQLFMFMPKMTNLIRK